MTKQITQSPRLNKKTYTYFDAMDIVSLQSYIKRNKAHLQVAQEVLRKKQYKKFIFVIPNEIKQYLDWKSKTTGTHKSVIVRDAIKNQADFKSV